MRRDMDTGHIKVLSFDCYGTLIDWERGIIDAFAPLRRHNPGLELSGAAALSLFAAHEHAVQAADPALSYEQVLIAVHRRIAAELGAATYPGLDQAFAGSIRNWPPFADTTAALKRLKRRYRLLILSNVDNAGIAASIARLGVDFDAVLTAEDIGAYKPDRRNFEVLLQEVQERFGVGRDGLLHVAQSLFHDIAPASALRIATAWIDRQHQRHGGHWGATPKPDPLPEPDMVFDDLAGLAGKIT
ncbi:MAG TPA: haloacid dehalogenase [Thermopetrobacter sp.]|nr:haloacid dehalogenase [Thermopetrobacter sp.]